MVGLPDISVTPTSVDFGSLVVGVGSSVDILISNSGTSTLQVTSGILSGPDSAHFSVGGGSINPCPAPPFTLNAGTNCNASVTFAPTAGGPKTATLTIASNDADSPSVQVALSGTGIPVYILTASQTGTGDGTITSTPAGIDCGSDCSETYASGTVVTLTASPAARSTFSGWSGDADCSDGTVTMDADKTCTATFTLKTRTLTVSKTGTGTGTVTSDPLGISCGGDCSETYNYGIVVALTATPDISSTFSGWSGNADCGDGIVTVNANKTCIAAFSIRTFTITPTVEGSGYLSCTASQVPYGGSSTCTITPESFNTITDVLVDGISVGAVGTYEFTNVTEDHTIHAVFPTVVCSWTLSGGIQTACVDTAAELQKCLYEAADDGFSNRLKIVRGTYRGTFGYSGTEDLGLELLAVGQRIAQISGYCTGFQSSLPCPESAIFHCHQ